MRVACAGVLLGLMAGTASAGERSAQLINSFQVMCTTEPLNFARLDAKAAAMQLPVHEDKRLPADPNGHWVRSKSWMLPLSSGPHLLAATEGEGPKGMVVGCGIAAPDADADDFRAELIKTMQLGAASSTRTDSPRRTERWPMADGAELMFWRVPERPGIYLILQSQPAK